MAAEAVPETMKESQSMDAGVCAALRKPWTSPALGAVLILLLTVTAYLPALRAGFVWDDHNNITDNQLLRTVEGLKRTWIDPTASFQYYPLTYTVFWVEYHLWALRPFGYHVVNVLLHALNAFLVWVLLSRLGVPGAWWAALLFAVHPVQVESVAWITELKNVVSEFFCLTAFLTFLRYWQRDRYRWWFYGGSVLLFLCALLSKTSAVALPWAIWLVIWWKQERVGWRDTLALIPFVAVSAVMALLTVWIEREYVGAHGPEWQLTFVERCLAAGRVVWFSVGKLVWPHPMMFIYPRWQMSQRVWWQYLFPLAAVAVVVVLWVMRKRVGKGPLAGVLFFVGTTAPVPAFMNLYFMAYSYVADHFQYLGSIGLMALAAAALSNLIEDWKRQVAVALPVVMVLGALSWQHCEVFADEETLWRDTLSKNPSAWMAHSNLGGILVRQGKVMEAIAEYRAALRIKPDDVETRNNLGLALAGLGDTDGAIAEYREALRVGPRFAITRNNLGAALANLGETEEAIAEYQEALEIEPSFVAARVNLGNALVQQGKLAEAAMEYAVALRVDPNRAEIHNSLGAILAHLGRVDEAIAEYRAVLRIDPNHAEAHYTLGGLLSEQGDAAEAIVHCREALRLRPDWPQALGTLAWLLATHGNADVRNGREAVQLAERLCSLTGGQQAAALIVLAAAYAEAGQFADAVRVGQEALESAQANNQEELARRIEGQLRFYQDGRPYHQPSASESP